MDCTQATKQHAQNSDMIAIGPCMVYSIPLKIILVYISESNNFLNLSVLLFYESDCMFYISPHYLSSCVVLWRHAK